MDRDYNASRNIRKMGLIKVGLVQPESTPVETATSGLRGIYPYRQMSVVEAGSSELQRGEYVRCTWGHRGEGLGGPRTTFFKLTPKRTSSFVFSLEKLVAPLLVPKLEGVKAPINNFFV
jgi:hypothetical protein